MNKHKKRYEDNIHTRILSVWPIFTLDPDSILIQHHTIGAITKLIEIENVLRVSFKEVAVTCEVLWPHEHSSEIVIHLHIHTYLFHTMHPTYKAWEKDLKNSIPDASKCLSAHNETYVHMLCLLTARFMQYALLHYVIFPSNCSGLAIAYWFVVFI